MSDRPPLESFLKWKLSIESPSLKYAAKAVTRNVILAVDIPFPLLKAWHEFLRMQRKESKTAVESQPHDEPSTSYPIPTAASRPAPLLRATNSCGDGVRAVHEMTVPHRVELI